VTKRSIHRGLVLLALLRAVAASAQPADHLQCYKAAPGLRVKGSLDVAPADGALPAAAGCKVRGPVAYCAPATTANVHTTPAPGNGAPGPPQMRHLCYRIKCKTKGAAVAATDRFGAFALQVGKSSLLCTPVAGGGTTTTTTTTLVPPCSSAPFPTCGGACPNALVCQAVAGGDNQIPGALQQYCACVPAALPCPTSPPGPTCAGGFGVCPTGQVCGNAVLAPVGAICGCVTP
jgi:hypothetical protein